MKIYKVLCFCGVFVLSGCVTQKSDSSKLPGFLIDDDARAFFVQQKWIEAKYLNDSNCSLEMRALGTDLEKELVIYCALDGKSAEKISSGWKFRVLRPNAKVKTFVNRSSDKNKSFFAALKEVHSKKSKDGVFISGLGNCKTIGLSATTNCLESFSVMTHAKSPSYDLSCRQKSGKINCMVGEPALVAKK